MVERFVKNHGRSQVPFEGGGGVQANKKKVDPKIYPIKAFCAEKK
jgi:hypothetical protein